MCRGLRALAAAAAVGLSACAPPALPPPVLADPPESMASTEIVPPAAASVSPPPLVLPEKTSSPQIADDERRRDIETLTKPLWFGWYAAVAAGDEHALDRSVARNRIHDDGRRAIAAGSLRFSTVPRIEDYRYSVTEVLRDERDCIVAALREDPGAFLQDAIEAARIGVFWKQAESWYLATSWTIDSPEFAWADDCSLMVRDFA